jgi:hypothetical protein
LYQPLTAFQLITPKAHNEDTIIPAAITPRTIEIKAYLNLILKRVAAITPVQAPVIGSGIATRIKSPKDSYLITFREFLFARSKTQSKKLDHILNLLR